MEDFLCCVNIFSKPHINFHKAMLDFLETVVTCIYCQELPYHPITTQCLHNFCKVLISLKIFIFYRINFLTCKLFKTAQR